MRDTSHPACGQKQFVQRSYLPSHPEAGRNGCPDGFVWGRTKHDVDPVLYQLPAVLQGIEDGRGVFIVEGEKDVHTLQDRGLIATTNPQGAGKWRRAYTDVLEDAIVYIVPDNDAEGRKHARRVARSLHGTADSVRIVELDDVPPKGDVTDWLKRGHDLEDLHAKVAATDEWEPQRDVAEHGPAGSNGQHPSPEEASIADSRYVASKGQILYVTSKSGTTKRRVVADFVAEIDREITREDGTRLYHVNGRTQKGRAFGFDIEASEFEQDRTLKSEIGAAAGAQSAVRAGMTRHIGAAIKRLSGDVTEVRRYDRTGWSKDGFIIPGIDTDDVDVQVPEALPYELPAGSNLDAGRKGLQHLLEAQDAEKTTALLSYVLTGPLVRHAGAVKRYGMFVKGRTGSLKTSFSQALMCLYGPSFIEDENLLKMGEGMTRNAAMALAASAHDVPILFDNYKPSTGRGDRDFINLIHNVVEGGEKARLNRNAELKAQRELRAWPLVTGEDLPDSDAASLARLLAVEFHWTNGTDNPDLTEAQNRAADLPAIGRAWIEWLQTAEGQDVASTLDAAFSEHRSKWAEYLRKHRPDMVNILRVASNLATNDLVLAAATKCPAFGDLIKPYRDAHRSGLREIAYEMGDYTCESLEARRFLEGLKSLKAAGRVQFTPRQGGGDVANEKRVGWTDEDGYYLVTDLALEAVEDLYQRSGGLGGVTKKTLYSQLEDIGMIAQSGRSRTTRPIRIPGGKQKRLLHLKRAALEEDEEGE
jgi:hypothetical protein